MWKIAIHIQSLLMYTALYHVKAHTGVSLVSALAPRHLVSEPRDAIVYALTRQRIARRYVPRLVGDLIQLQLLHALDGRERRGQIHLVGEEDDRHLQP